MRSEAPLHQLPGESARAFAALMSYVDMPAAERSTRKVAEQVGKSRSLIQRWSRKHVWVRRAEAYDAHQNAVYLAAFRRAREEMAERHAKLASALQAKLAQRLQALDPDTLTPRDMAYWLEVSTRVERQARGEPDKHEITGKNGGPIQFEQLGEAEQKERLQQLIVEATKRLDAVLDSDAA